MVLGRIDIDNDKKTLQDTGLSRSCFDGNDTLVSQFHLLFCLVRSPRRNAPHNSTLQNLSAVSLR